MSKESKEKLNKSKLGSSPWNKGLKTGPLSDELKGKLSEAGKNKIFTEEHRKNLSKALKGRKTPWVTWLPTPKPSKLGMRLVAVLQVCGFESIIPEEKFGKFHVDAFLQKEQLAFEADGKYWHNREWLERSGRTSNRLTDEERDKILLKEYNLPVVRLQEDEVNYLYKELISKRGQ